MNAEEELSQDLEALAAECSASYITSLTGSSKTTMKVGGSLSHVFEINSSDQLAFLLPRLKKTGLLVKTLGAGSNCILPTNGYQNIIITLAKSFDYFRDIGEGRIEVGAASMLPGLSLKLCQAGFSGLEFAAGIPGTVGGGIRMNCGAHNNEIANSIEEVKFISIEDGSLHVIKKAELNAAYRSVAIPANAIILSVILKLSESDTETVLAERQKCLSYRKSTQPLTMPSSGSVFRNPINATKENFSAGALIEKAGLKGMKIGGAEISSLHANWIVNPTREATSEDIRSLVVLCQAQVAQQFGVKLHTEIIFW